jgi:DNA-binding NtrC family response regulator
LVHRYSRWTGGELYPLKTGKAEKVVSVVSALATHIPRTLIADDQPDVLVALRLLLKSAGYQTEAANCPKAVLEAIKKRQFDVVLIDLNYARDTTSGQEGLDLISRIQAEDNSLPIVVMTAWGTVDLAVEAMRRGVRDFVQKPWENSRLLQVLRAQVEQGTQAAPAATHGFAAASATARPAKGTTGGTPNPRGIDALERR